MRKRSCQKCLTEVDALAARRWRLDKDLPEIGCSSEGFHQSNLMACTRGLGSGYPPDRNVENPGSLKALPEKSAARALPLGTKRGLARISRFARTSGPVCRRRLFWSHTWAAFGRMVRRLGLNHFLLNIEMSEWRSSTEQGIRTMQRRFAARSPARPSPVGSKN